MQRNATESRERIVLATGRILARQGHRALGINAIAAEAGVDKVLIYRYFGGLPGLLGTLAQSHPLWPSAERAIAESPSLERAIYLALLHIAHTIRTQPIAREVLAWELTERNEVTAELAATRERETERFLDTLRARFSVPPFIDLPALLAILTSALSYLALRSTSPDPTFTLTPSADPDWRRIERTAAAIVRMAVVPIE